MKIAINAGHYINTAGRRCMKIFDPDETREWAMNDRVARHVIAGLSAYAGVDILRIDDPTGKTDYTLKARTNKANQWGADYWLGVHHNAGIKGGSGGGTVVYRQNGSAVSLEYQNVVYDEMIKAAGLKGNRATPKAQANYHETRETKMPALLVECGFMDSSADTPLICKEDMSKKFATGIINAFVRLGELKKKEQSPAPSPQPNPVPGKPEDYAGLLVKVKPGPGCYYPGGAGIPSWVIHDYTHRVTQVLFNGKPVIKGGKTCVLLGEKIRNSDGKVESGINTWIDIDALEVVGPAFGYSTYTVKAGDTLWGIAAAKLGNGTRYKEIMALNGLKSDLICTGQVLKIPK